MGHVYIYESSLDLVSDSNRFNKVFDTIVHSILIVAV